MPRRAVNVAYDYFTRNVDDPTKYTCDACSATVASPKTASNLINHLKSSHKERYNAVLDEESKRKEEEANASHKEASMKIDDYVIHSLYKSSHPKQVGFGDGLE